MTGGSLKNVGSHEIRNDDANSGLVFRFGVRRRCGAGISGERAAQQAEGIEVPPSRILVDSGDTVKTDRRDRRKRARLLECYLLTRVPVLTAEGRAQREWLRMREGARLSCLGGA